MAISQVVSMSCLQTFSNTVKHNNNDSIGDDIAAAAGPLQVCAGQVASCEAAIHAMRDLFQRQLS